jgi:hypothetical protein
MTIDRASLEELIQNADIEGFIAKGSPADEYDLEVDSVLKVLQQIPPGLATGTRIISLFEDVWRKAFSLSEDEIMDRREAFEEIADKLLHFFPDPE